ncbi:MAG: KamA family radical SAM protein, partial [Desulfomonilia bacterium]
SGVLVNNQTVLLNGVNDDPAILAALQNNLAGIGINPYYIFQCRPVKRVQHHFQVPLHQGYDIVEAAKGMLNGHSKRFRFIMSHRKGKIEIVGRKHDEIFFKFHQARNPANTGKFFSRHISPGQGWLADTEEIAPGRVYGAAS